MTTSWTFLRFLNSIVLAKAVLKAVISAAFINPRGVPLRLRRVKLPLGLVPWPFIFFARISSVMSGGTSNGVVWLLALVDVAAVDPELRDMELTRESSVSGSLLVVLPSRILLDPLGLVAESESEKLPTRPLRLGSPGGLELLAQTSLRVTILTPILSMLLAGMNSVVEPSFRVSCVLFG
jgi:hypothetical protein